MLKRLNRNTPFPNKRCSIIRPVITIELVAAQSLLQITCIVRCQSADKPNLPSRHTASGQRTSIRIAPWCVRSTGFHLHFLAMCFVRNILVQCLGDSITIVVSISNASQFECLAYDGWMCRSYLSARYFIR